MSTNNKPTTDRGIAETNLRRTAHAMGMARRKLGLLGKKPTWTGTMTPEWAQYIAMQNPVSSYEYEVKNFRALLKRDDSGYSRRLGFDSYGNLVLDGDWICNLNGGADDYCLVCAKAMLLEGSMDPENAWAYLLSVDQPDYTVECTQCGNELWHFDEEPEEDPEGDGTDDQSIALARGGMMLDRGELGEDL